MVIMKIMLMPYTQEARIFIPVSDCTSSSTIPANATKAPALTALKISSASVRWGGSFMARKRAFRTERSLFRHS